MGITIHYRLRFKGSEKRVVELLPEIGAIAKELGFIEHTKLWRMDYTTDYNTPDKWTPLVAGENNDKGRQFIDESYRWAKIQYEPNLIPMLSYQDSPAVRRQKERQIIKARERIKQYSGWVQHLWFGDGCEPTNLGLVHQGNSRLWTGSAFTKTEWADDFMKAHLSICVLLKEIRRLGILESVSDETDFWNTGEINRLTGRRESNSEEKEVIKSLWERFQITGTDDGRKS